MSWSDFSDWWLGEIADDPTYKTVVTPLLLDILNPVAGASYVDLGSGEGNVMREVQSTGAVVLGVEVSESLAMLTPGRTVVAELPQIPMGTDSLDGAFAVLVLEHLLDHVSFFTETARVVRSEGVLALVVNHPIWTAPDSTPITDTDGEVLWRPGKYFSTGKTEVPAGEVTVTFHHRPMASLLNVAAEAGWSLEQMIETPPNHELEGQAGIPRLLACRWRLLP